MYRVNNKIYPLSIDKMNTINLSSLEKGEINNYNINTIYFSGSIKKTQIYFTDLELYYIGKIHDHIYFRYEILENLGKGSYSNVFKIYDHKYNKNYALKISKSSEKYNSSIQHEIDILNICKNIYLKEYYEIRAENKLNGKNENNHDIINNNNITNNITNELIALYDTSFIYRNHTMIKLRIYGDNLYSGREKFKKMEFHDKLTISKQMFQALEFLKKCPISIIHGDIKPENILFKNNDADCINIVLTDFGLSKISNEYLYLSRGELLQSRYYRAPEIIFNIKYNINIDIWSVGCVIYEIFKSKPLIYSKEDNDVLLYIHGVLGIPTDDYINSDIYISKNYTKNNNQYYPNKITDYKGKKVEPNSLNNTLISVEPIFDKLFDLIKKCVKYDDTQRITPEEAIELLNTFYSK
jgi:dual specificity tyrosine-phosphorylation-regulated kinase 2/3/4